MTASQRRGLPHPLFCASCPSPFERMPECPEFEPTSRTQSERGLVSCRHYVIEMTVVGPVPGCVRRRVQEPPRNLP
jgi:hypothetical protein